MISFAELSEGITKPVPMNTIVRKMQGARSKLVGKPVIPSTIAKALESTVKKVYGVEFTYKFVSGFQGGDMNANAYYDPDADQDGDTPIEIELLFSSKDKKRMDIDNEGFDVLIKIMAKNIAHELLHKSQYSNRRYVETKPFKVSKGGDPKVATAQKYLGNSDEIEAYGHNIAVELMNNLGSRKKALTALRNFVKIPPDKSPDLYAYLVAFGMDKDHPVLKKLVKKVILFLKELDK
jgi:hypothetical protein